MSVQDSLKGFGITFKQFLKSAETIDYPDQKTPVWPRFRGRHRLWLHDNGLEKCVGCSLCAAACPADCIRVVAEENTAEHRVSAGERYAKIYEINMLRCIFCGLCVEACPTEAITMTHLFEMSVTDRNDAIYTKKELLVDPDGIPNHMFTREQDPMVNLGELKEADGWMRATAPSGRAAYEGIPGWSRSAGIGLRPPERGQAGDLPESEGGEDD
jgi:NADH-quinone oxidoreductase subunit I